MKNQSKKWPEEKGLLRRNDDGVMLMPHERIDSGDVSFFADFGWAHCLQRISVGSERYRPFNTFCPIQPYGVY